jgi:hypothetical protein
MEEVLGALVGVAIGWILSETASARLQDRRAKRRARFEVVREMMRMRHQPERRGVLNEIPLFFGDDPKVMTLWREIAAPKTPGSQREVEVLTKQSTLQENKMLAAMVKAVGLPSVADNDLDNYIGIGSFAVLDTDRDASAP